MATVGTMMLPLSRVDVASKGDSLRARVEQIILQKGVFRNVTEKTLLDEIETHRSGDVPQELEEDEDDDGEETPESKQEKVWKGREEMLKQLERARNDTLHALDFVSFLLSKHAPAAKSSMSPFLQQAVPDGTLDARIVQVEPLTRATRHRLESVSLGWKSSGFKRVAEKISEASSRLATDAVRESAFWDQVAALKGHGWPVSRLPRDTRTIGVHFGFPEAAVRFRNRGFAVLTCDEIGQLRLGKGSGDEIRYSLRVAMLQNGRMTGHSQPALPTVLSESGVEDHLSEARRSLFDEELFHEASREARILANQGVVMTQNGIEMDVTEDQQVRLELVESEKLGKAEHVEDCDATAEAACMALRILLSKAHQQRLVHRSAAPPPLKLTSEPPPECLLLRPLLGWFRLRASSRSMRDFCTPLFAVLTQAGLDTSLRISYSSAKKASVDGVSQGIPAALLDCPEYLADITLPSGQHLEMRIKTHLGPPSYGPEYTIANLEYDFGNIRPPRITNATDLEHFICQVLQMDIVAVVEKTSRSNNDERSGHGESWTATNAYSGDMELLDSTTRDARLLVKVGAGRLALRYLCQNVESQKLAENVSYVWELDMAYTISAAGRAEVEPQHLLDVVRALRDDEDGSIVKQE